MTAQENEALVRRYIEEAFNKGNMAIVDEVFAANLQNHSAPPGRSPGIEGVREFVRRVRAEWPDIRITIDDQVAEGKIVEGDVLADIWNHVTQLGETLSPPQGTATAG